MLLRIVAVGKLPKEAEALCEHYRGMLRRRWKVEVVEIPESPARRTGNIERAKKEETERMLNIASKSRYKIVLLDVRGKEVSSEEFASFLKERELEGGVQFLIGGPDGVSAKAFMGSDFTLSLSKMTFSHVLARVMLFEQIYRAFAIMYGLKYVR